MSDRISEFKALRDEYARLIAKDRKMDAKMDELVAENDRLVAENAGLRDEEYRLRRDVDRMAASRKAGSARPRTD